MKKHIPFILILCICLSLFTISAAAEDTEPTDSENSLTDEEVVGELAEQMGQSDTERLMDALQQLLDTTRAMSDEELSAEIRAKGDELGIPLNDTQIDMLLDLYRRFESLNESEIAQKIEDMKATVEKLRDFAEKARDTKETVDEYAKKAGGFLQKLKSLWDSFFDA